MGAAYRGSDTLRHSVTSRILVVDDSPTIRKVVGIILERHGYEVIAAADGQYAFEILTGTELPEGGVETSSAVPRVPATKVDLVLLDFVMPRMNGYQFCRAVRQKQGLATLPVVLMSAKSDKIRDQFVTQTGAIDAISKPFDARALVAVIENALRRVETGRASAARLPEIDGDDDDMSSSVTTAPGGDILKRAKVTADIGAKLGTALGPALAAMPPSASTPEDLGNLFTSRLTDQLLRDLGASLRELEVDDASRAALSGDIAIIPIGAVLQMLQVEGQSGVLTVWSGISEITLTMRGGLIDLAQSRLAGDEFRLGRYLVEEGLVTPDEIERLLNRDPALPPSENAEAQRSPPPVSFIAAPPLLPTFAPSSVPPTWDSQDKDRTREKRPTVEPETLRLDGEQARLIAEQARALMEMPSERSPFPSEDKIEGGVLAVVRSDPPPPSPHPSQELLTALPTSRLLGEVLLHAGRITDEQLRGALIRQSSELVYEILRWARGRFDFKRRPATSLAHGARLGLTVPAVVMEGFRRVDEWRALEATLANFDSVLVPDAMAVAAMGDDALPRTERVVLDAIDGERTIREVVAASHMSSFDACRILVQLIEARVVRRRLG